MSPDPAELTLVDRWQHNFPLVDKPFEVIGRAAALNERETIRVFRRLREIGVISRIGAVVRPNTVGASTLAALQVPAERLEQVAAIVSREPLVTHNYERTHALNLWFVIAGADAHAIAATIESIRQKTGLEAIDLPMLRAYHLGLGFPLGTGLPSRREAAGPRGDYRPDPLDRIILAAIQDGLPLVEQPYRAVAEQLDLDQAEIIDRLDHLTAAGIVTRFGCVVRHDKLGYDSNAMAVWDVPDDMVDTIAASFTRNPHVTLCYRRPRHLPLWPYNMFCMIHAKARRDAYAAIDEINLQADTGLNTQAVLFSTRCFKQRGAVFSDVRQGLN
jgi:DNA-binding Lrp family transcriptional regulator